MNTEETIRRAIAKAASAVRTWLRGAAEAGDNGGVPSTKKTIGSGADAVRGEEVLSRMEFYSSLNMDAEWRSFRRGRLARPVRRAWLRWGAVAAGVLLLVSATFVLLSRHADKSRPQYSLFDSRNVRPGSRTALLTIGGDNYRLSADMRLEFMPTEVRLTAGHGRSTTVRRTAMRETTTLTVPRGGEYSLTLADGTQVWLNAGSRLTFPAEDESGERRVELEGEAYFEVAKNEAKPFYVSVGDIQVHVTGTAFNVKAREGRSVEVSLLSGSVLMERRDGGLLAALKPGQRFSGEADGGSFSVGEADMETALAWHNGLFVFKDEPLGSIAEQLSLWYNIDITVPQELSDRRYSGELNRYKSIEPLLEVLRLTGEMEFLSRGEGRMEIVTKGK